MTGIPSHKFLPLIYQLAARMEHAAAAAMPQFHAVLNDLILKVFTDRTAEPIMVSSLD